MPPLQMKQEISHSGRRGRLLRRQFLTVRHHVCKITKPSMKSVLVQNKEKHIIFQSDDHGKVNINALYNHNGFLPKQISFSLQNYHIIIENPTNTSRLSYWQKWNSGFSHIQPNRAGFVDIQVKLFEKLSLVFHFQLKTVITSKSMEVILWWNINYTFTYQRILVWLCQTKGINMCIHAL